MARLDAWQRAGQDESSIERYLVVALERSGLCITVQNGNQDYLYIANLFDGWPVSKKAEPDDASLFGPKIADEIKMLKRNVTDLSKRQQAEIVTDDDSCFDFTVEAISTGAGSYYILTRIVDLSEKRTAERVTKALLREVSHRSKNLLAIIQSLASQTARNSSTIEGFTDKFRGRLHALSKAQDLVTESSWRGAMLRDLVRDQAAGYFPDDRQIEFEGPNIRLAPNVSLHLGLALHELTIKATRAAQISGEVARASVFCRKTWLDGQSAVELTWKMPERQTDGKISAVANDAEGVPNFSRVLLEKVVPASMSGHAELVHAGGEKIYTIVFPISDATAH